MSDEIARASARAAVEVSGLFKDYKVEIDAIAYVF